MKIIKFFLIVYISTYCVGPSYTQETEILKNKISKNIRCLICQGQSIYDSQSDFAESMKLLIEKKLNEGLEEKQVYDFLINRYGQWITYNTGFNEKTFVLWLLPILLFCVGGAIIIRKLLVQKQ
jgi:cytochrome c-type biogenesis protein CcmH|tara:strand:- start:1052 stop:1423 length:372 start_codon:yes stop_codon:yes gene_type:complete